MVGRNILLADVLLICSEYHSGNVEENYLVPTITL